MPLAALIIAGEDSAGPAILGQPLIEFQMRRARGAGAAHIVLLVERVPAALLAGIDRLRREGLTIDVARTVADAAEFIHPDERVLLLAPDLIVAPAQLAALATATAPTILCVRDAPANDRFELIDPTARWTGCALIDGGLVRRTAAMVGDWDLASTLLRRAVQEDAARILLSPEDVASDLETIDERGDGRRAGRAMLGAGERSGEGWGSYWVLGPAARLAARYAGEAGADPGWLTIGGTAVMAAAAFGALSGWILLPLAAALLGLTAVCAGEMAALAGGRVLTREALLARIRAVAWIVTALAIGRTMGVASGQWGCMVLAAAIVGSVLLAAPLGGREDARRWLADPAGLALTVLAGTLLVFGVAALAIAAMHAAASLAWLQRRNFPENQA